MKLPILSAATILLMSFISANSAIAQSERITCIRTQNVINCPGYGRFNYRSNSNNSNYNRQDLDRAINNIYQQYLGRNADPTGLLAYRNSILNGGNIEDVRNAIANSSEARNRNGNNSNNNLRDIDRAINNIYQQYLGRNADPAGLLAYRNSIINGGNIEDVRNAIANSPEAINRNRNSTFNKKDNKKVKDVKNEVSNSSEDRNRNGNSSFDRKDNKKEKYFSTS